MILVSILVATFVSGVLSVLLAGWLALPLLARMLPHMVSLSTGVMLAAAAGHRHQAAPRAPLSSLAGCSP